MYLRCSTATLSPDRHVSPDQVRDHQIYEGSDFPSWVSLVHSGPSDGRRTLRSSRRTRGSSSAAQRQCPASQASEGGRGRAASRVVHASSDTRNVLRLRALSPLDDVELNFLILF